jgi:hypothetical protein
MEAGLLETSGPSLPAALRAVGGGSSAPARAKIARSVGTTIPTLSTEDRLKDRCLSGYHTVRARVAQAVFFVRESRTTCLLA